MELRLQTKSDRLLALYDFTRTHQEICNAHTVDFFTEDSWDHLIPEEWKTELLSDDMREDPSVFLNPEPLKDSPLKDFLLHAKQLKLLLKEIPTSNDDDDDNGSISPIDRFGMTEKKAHEVKKMATHIHSVAKLKKINQVIDIGSGKGYLSEYLSFVHGYKVYGIDSSSTNREGALDRSRKLNKYFGKYRLQSAPLVNVPDIQSLIQPISDISINTGHPQLDTNDCVLQKDINTDVQSVHLLPSTESIGNNNTNSIHCITETNPLCSSHSNTSTIHCITENTDSTKSIDDKYCYSYKQSSDTIVSDTVLCENDNNGDIVNKDDTQQTTSTVVTTQITDTVSSSVGGFFKPLTHYIDDDSLLRFIHDSNSDDLQQPLILVGLHTCGDLASIGLKQFVSNDLIKAVCIVGCCYHHITETGDCPGFPMSDCLKSRGAFLGRKARMLSCQSEGRFEAVTSGSSLMSVFYRAILQVIFKNEMKLFKSKEEATSLCVGRVKKYSSFVQYCRKAMKRLNIPIESQPSDNALEQFHHQYYPKMIQVQRYLQIRAVIAPVIESLIIADRYHYLKEQKNVESAWIVQLFSPSISPRCVGLCAYK